MPFAVRDGTRLWWRADGEADKPPLLLLNSIGTDLGSWDPVVPYLTPHAHVLRMDTRGHGASDAPEGEYSLDVLARDALAVLDAAGADHAAVCGVSLGGMTAMTMALIAPERLEALIPACTSSKMDRKAWEGRIEIVREGGTAAVADMAMKRFFDEDFRRTHRGTVETTRAGLLAMSSAGYIGACAAVRDMDLTEALRGVTVPTLLISARKDVSTPFEGHGDAIAAAIPGAQTAFLDAAHLAQLEAPAAFAATVVQFLREVRGEDTRAAEDALFEAGLKTRRKVLGDAWVDKALANRTEFNGDYQAMITRIAWKEIWTRPGLDHRTRRLLVLAVTASLARWEEFRLHVRAGLQQGGFSEDELKETLMQLAIYAGVPAANTAFTEAGEVMAELAKEKGEG